MKLVDIKNGIGPEWAAKGYQMPKFDIEAVRAKPTTSLHGFILEPEIFSVHFRRQFCSRLLTPGSMTEALS